MIVCLVSITPTVSAKQIAVPTLHPFTQTPTVAPTNTIQPTFEVTLQPIPTNTVIPEKSCTEKIDRVCKQFLPIIKNKL